MNIPNITAWIQNFLNGRTFYCESTGWTHDEYCNCVKIASAASSTKTLPLGERRGSCYLSFSISVIPLAACACVTFLFLHALILCPLVLILFIYCPTIDMHHDRLPNSQSLLFIIQSHKYSLRPGISVPPSNKSPAGIRITLRPSQKISHRCTKSYYIVLFYILGIPWQIVVLHTGECVYIHCWY